MRPLLSLAATPAQYRVSSKGKRLDLPGPWTLDLYRRASRLLNDFSTLSGLSQTRRSALAFQLSVKASPRFELTQSSDTEHDLNHIAISIT